MSAARIAAEIVLVVTVGLPACSDGGPPGAADDWDCAECTRTGAHHASETAADGGVPAPADAADNVLDETSDATHRAQRVEDSKADAGASAQALAMTALCDGSPGITFSALAIGGGQPQPGTQVMAENGYNFLIVEGNCQYWALDGMLSHVTTGTLSDAEQRSVVDSFQLDQWQLNTGSTATNSADGPTYFMLFGRELNALDCTASDAADGCKTIANPGKFRELPALLNNYSSLRDQLSAKGKPLTADVRYVLVNDAQSFILDWQAPGSWPLGDPAKVAISPEQAASYMPGQSQHARGSDAQALQELWRKFLDGEISGHGQSIGIPVEVAGERYALFLRDSIPLENDRGLILF